MLRFFLILLTSSLINALYAFDNVSPLSVNGELTISFSSLKICPYDSVQVDMRVPNYPRGSYIINGPGGILYKGDISNSLPEIHDLKIPGIYNLVQYQLKDANDVVIETRDTSISFEISHFELPSASLSGGGEYCEGDTITPLVMHLTGSDPWSVSYIPNNQSIVTNIYNTPEVILADNSSNSYELRIVTDQNCRNEIFETGYLQISELPVAEINGDTVFCPGETAIYSTPNNAGYTYTWSIPEGAQVAGSGSNEGYFTAVEWVDSGNHMIDLEVELSKTGCSTRRQKSVFVYALPDVKQNYDTIICFGRKGFVTLSPSTSEENTIYWVDQETEGPSIDVTEEGTYSYTETIPYGCVANGSINVIEYCILFFVPEAFTPNGDGINDILEIHGNLTNFRLEIYSTYGGQLIYVMMPGSDPWDGTIDGQEAQNGVYYWKASYVDEYELNHQFEGRFTLMR